MGGGSRVSLMSLHGHPLACVNRPFAASPLRGSFVTMTNKRFGRRPLSTLPVEPACKTEGPWSLNAKLQEIMAALSAWPATALLEFSAILFSGWVWAGHDLERWTLDARAFQGEPWRLITSALPHANILHLAFNVYWLWVFGSRIETVFGSLRTAALMALLAAGSGEAEYALLDGGIGLSGVNYGLFGFLWVLERRDARFHGVVDRRTTELFAGWFLLCIILTSADVMRVANIAHAAGWLLGLLAGVAVTARSRLRRGLLWSRRGIEPAGGHRGQCNRPPLCELLAPRRSRPGGDGLSRPARGRLRGSRPTV